MDFTKIPGALSRSKLKPAPFLTRQDTVLLENLMRDVASGNVDGDGKDDAEDYALLHDLSDGNSDRFEPQVFTGWGAGELEKLPASVQKYLLQPYVAWASRVVRRPTDVVFLTHILIYLSTSVPSAVYLYYNFTWIHGICHYLMQLFYCGPFTLMLHNHIHNAGVLSFSWAWLDRTFPYILEPLMGHTWDSYFYHHVKHHHAEGNGPEDLSSTVRYQRDELTHFLHYVGRFLLFVWLELPWYFVRKGRYNLAVRSFVSEVTSYAFVVLMWRYNWRPTLFAFVIPLLTMRIGMMTGNWGQHAFVDLVDPDSAYRSSITLIDVSSNRYCFNDGYHTSHHLNPRRHWRDHPHALLKAKRQYASGHALLFRSIDYLEITIRLLMKDYDHLAGCLVPIGEQMKMSKKELADMLRTKTVAFSEEDIKKTFYRQANMGVVDGG